MMCYTAVPPFCLRVMEPRVPLDNPLNLYHSFFVKSLLDEENRARQPLTLRARRPDVQCVVQDVQILLKPRGRVQGFMLPHLA